MEDLNTSQTNPQTGSTNPTADQMAEESGAQREATPEIQGSDTAPGAAPNTASEQTGAPQAGSVNPPPQQPQPAYHLPPGYTVDPATGQVIFVGPVMQQPTAPGYVQPNVIYAQPQLTPEQIAAQQAASQQRYGQIINSVEKFIEGDATVSDVVKTLYTNVAQDDQLWKGVIVGAAAAVLLTSEPVRDAMGKTFGALYPGLKKNQPTTGKSPVIDPDKETVTDLPTTSDKE